MLLIDFFETTPISSLVPINSLKPDRVVFLISADNLSSKKAEHIRKAVTSLNCVKEFAYQTVDITNIRAMQESIQKIVSRQKDGEKVYLDLTGGSERMVAAGYSAAVNSDAIPVFADVRASQMLRVDTNEVIAAVEHIHAEEYFLAIGAKKFGTSHTMPEGEEAERICEMAELLFDRVSDWHALSESIARQVSETGDLRHFTVPKNLRRDNQSMFDPDSLVDEFEKRGFVRSIGDHGYEFPNDKYREYMTTFGIWLEMYIYLCGRNFFDEAYLGMIIDWNVDDDYDSEDNEIDVVFVKDSIPYFISCKMRRIEAPDIYEIGFIAEHFGGHYAKRYIATTYPLDMGKPGPKSLRMKMMNMDVGLINTRDVKEKGIEAVLFPEAMKESK